MKQPNSPDLATAFPFSWVEQTAERIYESPTFRQALTVVASNLSDLLDTLIPLSDSKCGVEGQYPAFCELKIKELGAPSDQLDREHLYFLETTRNIFHLYRKQNSMADWELEYEAGQIFVPEFDLKMDKEEAMRIIFAHTCSYFQSWTEGSIELNEERWREWELRSLREWPDSIPHDDPPDGMDEFMRVGREL